MLLTRVRVTNFKCVLDSDWFTVDQLTCLVGKNESGKTAILEAIEKLNSVEDDRAGLETTEYPRINYSEYEETDQVDIALHTEWSLGDDEAAHINGLIGVEVLRSTTVSVTKDYDNRVEWTVELDHKAAADALASQGKLTASDIKAIGNPSTVDRLIKGLKALEEPTVRQRALRQDVASVLIP